MYCKNCGKEIPDGARFCVNCGASQDPSAGYGSRANSTAGNQQQNQWQNQQFREPNRQDYRNNDTYQGGGSPDESFGIILKYVSLALALLWFVFGIRALFGGIGTMISSLNRYAYYRPFFWFFTGFFGVIMAIAFVAEAISLVACGLSEKKEFGDSKFLLVAGSGVLILLAAVFRMIFGSIATYRFAPSYLLPILWMLLTVATAYVLMMMAGMNPLPSDIGQAASGIGAVLAELMSQASKLKNSAGNVASAGAGSFRANQQAAMNQRNMNRQNAANNQNQQAQGPQFQNQQFQNQGMPYQNQQFQNQGPASMGIPMGNGVRLNQSRGILKYVLLNFCTCGIYSFFFIYKLAQDINIACAGDGEEDIGGLGSYILYSFLTCGVYATVWEYSLMNRMKANAPRYGITQADNGLTILLWAQLGTLLCGVGPFVAMHKICKSANAICAAYNRANGL